MRVMLKQAVQSVARSFGYQFSKISESASNPELVDYPCIDLLDLVMQDYMQQNPDIFFVQIGAHDGLSADPAGRLIRRHPWRGVLVEPHPVSFKQLLDNYQENDRLIFEQLAIAKEDGTATFYSVRNDIPNLPFWLPQSACLDRQHVWNSLYYWKHVKKLDIPDDFDSLITEIPVPALTMHSLLKKHQVEKLDLLVLATPGFDFEILKMFPFEQHKPPIICFEYLCLTEREACLRFLADLGYSVGRFASRAVASLDTSTIKWTIGEY